MWEKEFPERTVEILVKQLIYVTKVYLGLYRFIQSTPTVPPPLDTTGVRTNGGVQVMKEKCRDENIVPSTTPSNRKRPTRGPRLPKPVTFRDNPIIFRFPSLFGPIKRGRGRRSTPQGSSLTQRNTETVTTGPMTPSSKMIHRVGTPRSVPYHRRGTTLIRDPTK